MQRPSSNRVLEYIMVIFYTSEFPAAGISGAKLRLRREY